jgi:hypothetical protein
LDVALEWDVKVTNILNKISTLKTLCPPSNKFPGLRRCTKLQHSGKTTGVFIPINEWNKLKDKFKGID